MLGERLGWIWPNDELEEQPSGEKDDEKMDEDDSKEFESTEPDASTSLHDKGRDGNTEEETVVGSIQENFGQVRGGGDEEMIARKQSLRNDHIDDDRAEAVDLTREFIEAGLLSPYAESLEL